ncbi:MAG: HD-GYP domain-containing protein [Chloroflexota bacterium]
MSSTIFPRSFARQPAIGIVTGVVAVSSMGMVWYLDPPTIQPLTLLLTALLAVALTASYSFPVHIQRSTKVCMGSVALYLLATLAPPVVACLAAGIGVAIGTSLTRSESDLLRSDIATDAGRWMLVCLAGSLVAHNQFGSQLPQAASFLLAAAILWSGDTFTAPFLYGPITNEPPWRIIRTLVSEGGTAEAYQYLLGFLGALAEMELPGAMFLLLVAIVPLHVAFRRGKETQESTLHVLEAMADAVDLRDPYTGGHSQRVAGYVSRILETMRLHGLEVDLIVSAARVHDIGKIGTPDAVLLKDGKLSPEERLLMEQHAVHGSNLLSRYHDFARGAAIVRSHHEQWDGKGYPDGLRGTDIPFGARVIAVADSFDAMTSDRPYRKGMDAERAIGILLDGRGSQWDADVVAVFLTALGHPIRAPQPAAALPAPAAALGGARFS